MHNDEELDGSEAIETLPYSFEQQLRDAIYNLIYRVKALEDACHRHGIEVEEVKQP